MFRAYQETDSGAVIEISKEAGRVRLVVDSENPTLGGLMTADQCLELEQKLKAIREAKP